MFWSGSKITNEERILVWVRGRGQASAADISYGLHMWSGTLYPLLHVMLEDGRLESTLEGTDDPLLPGLPRRRLYSVPAPTPWKPTT